MDCTIIIFIVIIGSGLHIDLSLIQHSRIHSNARVTRCRDTPAYSRLHIHISRIIDLTVSHPSLHSSEIIKCFSLSLSLSCINNYLYFQQWSDMLPSLLLLLPASQERRKGACYISFSLPLSPFFLVRRSQYITCTFTTRSERLIHPSLACASIKAYCETRVIRNGSSFRYCYCRSLNKSHLVSIINIRLGRESRSSRTVNSILFQHTNESITTVTRYEVSAFLTAHQVSSVSLLVFLSHFYAHLESSSRSRGIISIVLIIKYILTNIACRFRVQDSRFVLAGLPLEFAAHYPLLADAVNVTLRQDGLRRVTRVRLR